MTYQKQPSIIVISAPSGTGKSSVIAQIINDPELRLSFSISATNRPPRGTEKHGTDYFFISQEEFQKLIETNQFVEYVEVYPGRYYGTLKSELDRIHNQGFNLILDIDVEGALKVKKQYPNSTFAIFLAPPSLQALRERLNKRGTDSPEVIEQRLARATYELTLAQNFDLQVVNDKLDECVQAVRSAIAVFLKSQ